MNEFDTGKRYPALRVIVVVIKIMAALVVIVGLVTAFLAMRSGQLLPAIGITVGVLVAFLGMWASAESISVIIDIEANTRASAMAAQKTRQEPTLQEPTWAR